MPTQGAPHSSDQAEGGNQATTQNGQTDTKPTHRPMSQEGIPPTHRPYPFDGPPSMNGSMDRGDYHHRVPYPPNGHHQYPPRPPFFSSNPQQHRMFYSWRCDFSLSHVHSPFVTRCTWFLFILRIQFIVQSIMYILLQDYPLAQKVEVNDPMTFHPLKMESKVL